MCQLFSLWAGGLSLAPPFFGLWDGGINPRGRRPPPRFLACFPLRNNGVNADVAKELFDNLFADADRALGGESQRDKPADESNWRGRVKTSMQRGVGRSRAWAA